MGPCIDEQQRARHRFLRWNRRRGSPL